jgi:CxxC-x17-CxxC domain-containing protein
LATDETLRCRDCGRDFVFTVGEQKFFEERGLLHKPSRCPECRAARKGQAGGSYPGERSARPLYSAVCSNCGQEARVPFQPRGDKPVYCSDCFQQMGGARSGSRSGTSGYSRY